MKKQRTTTALRTVVAAGILATAVGRAPAANDIAGNLLTLKQNGGWCWYQDERAFIDNGQLIFGSVAGVTNGAATAGDIQATSYNLADGTTVVKTLAAAFQTDDHDAPAFLVLPTGQYLAIWEKHGSDNLMQRAITTTAGSIANWGATASFTANPANDGNGNSYSHVFQLSAEGGKIYSFSRAIGYDPNYMVSTDNGQTFTYGGRLMTWVNPNNSGPGRPYVKYASNGVDRIWLTTTEDHPRNYNNSIYAGYIQGGNVYQSNGTLIGPLSTTQTSSISPTNFTKIFQGDADNVAWTTDLEIGADGNPYTAFTVRKNGGLDIRYHYARFNGSAWTEHEIAYGGSYLYAAENDYSGLIALDPKDPNQVVISTNANPVTGAALISGADSLRHWELFKGVTADSGATWNWSQVTSNSTVDNIRPILVENPTGESVLIWMRGSYSSYTSFNTDVVALLGYPTGLNHWNVATGGPWETAGNWKVGVPNASAATAYFGLGPVAPAGNSTITLTGGKTVGAMTFGGTTSFALVPGAGGSLTLNNGAMAAVLTVVGGSHSIGVPVALSSSGLSMAGSAGTLTIGGVVSGTGGITMGGSAVLVLAGANTYTGVTTIPSGMLVVTGSIGTSSSITLSSGGSGVLRAAASDALGALTVHIQSNGGAVGPTSRFEVAGGIALANPIILSPRNNGSVAIESVGGNNTLSGGITIGVGGTQGRIQSDAGTLTLSGGLTASATAARNVYLQGAGDGVVSGVISNNGANASGTVAVHKEGSGAWTLTGANTYTGGVYVDGGTLGLGSAGALGTSGTIAFNGGTIRYSAANAADYSGRIGNSAGAIGVDTNGFAVTYGSVLAASNTGGLAKYGNGTLTLAAANGYTGATVVNGGVLALGNGSSAVTDTVGTLGGAGTLRISALANVTSGAMQVGTYVLNGTHTLANGSGVSSISGTAAFGAAGRLNLGDGQLVVQATGATVSGVVGTLAQGVAAARNGGSWNGTTGISQATVAANPAGLTLAVAVNGELALPLTTLGGVALDGNSVLVTPAVPGDADLSGTVDLGDFNRWFGNVGGATGSFTRGDFDASGIVDLGDFNLWFSHVGAVGPLVAQGVVAVPEAGTGLLVGMGCAWMVRGRRRRRC